MSDSTRVVITGIGAVSAVGRGADDLWSAVVQGRSGIRRIEEFVRAGLPVTVGGNVSGIDVEESNREVGIAVSAIQETLRQSGLTDGRYGFVWSTGLESYRIRSGGLSWNSSGAIYRTLSARFLGPKRMIAMACASGTAAIGEAFWLVRSGSVDACLAGGSSSMLNPFYILGFAGLQALAVESNGADASAICKPFDKNRNGFALSDGAGALMLESLPSALTRGATILAEIVGYGVSQDAFDLNRPCDDGAGAELCMRRAVEDAGLTPADISAVNAHGTGTYVGDLAEAAALKRFLGPGWMNIPVSSVKGAIGHALAASGALEAVVGVRTCHEGLVPMTTNLTEPGDGCDLGHVIGNSVEAEVHYLLSNSFGMGGQNATIILRQFRQ